MKGCINITLVWEAGLAWKPSFLSTRQRTQLKFLTQLKKFRELNYFSLKIKGKSVKWIMSYDRTLMFEFSCQVKLVLQAKFSFQVKLVLQAKFSCQVKLVLQAKFSSQVKLVLKASINIILSYQE